MASMEETSGSRDGDELQLERERRLVGLRLTSLD